VPPADLVYRIVLRAAPAALRLAAPFSGKLRRGLDGRRASLHSLLDWAAAARDPERPLIWLHAPSVGEALMAQAILAAARDRAPEAQAVFTFFSPSAERVAALVGADWSGYLPWDRATEMGEAISALRPTAIGFVRTELWPVLAQCARRANARVVLVNAVLAEGSSRLGAPARALLGPAYRALDAIGAVHAVDCGRFARLGIAADRVHVTGDARFDQV
jgi:3-deoxy-D-manno-octulosonic-acid transferase